MTSDTDTFSASDGVPSAGRQAESAVDMAPGKHSRDFGARGNRDERKSARGSPGTCGEIDSRSVHRGKKISSCR